MTIHVRVRVRIRPPVAAPVRPGLRRVQAVDRGLAQAALFVVLIARVLIWLPVLFVLVVVFIGLIHPTTDTGNDRPTAGATP